jgi:hypothetical protein
MIAAEPRGYDLEQLDAFQDLLPALARGLDVRDVFQHLSAIASRIVPHDEANLALLTENPSQFRLHASTHDSVEAVGRGRGCPIRDADEPQVFDGARPSVYGRAGASGGHRRSNGWCVRGHSRRPIAFRLRPDSASAWLSCRGPLAPTAGEDARRAAAEQRASSDSSRELLRTVADVLDIRTVFPRLSEIANRMLPHDGLTMMFQDQNGHIVLEAASTDEFPALTRVVKTNTCTPDQGFTIIDDLRTAALPIAEPVDLRSVSWPLGIAHCLVW